MLEAAYAKLQRHPEPRPLNLDPGYLTSAKLVLASTKDHAHRIYLSRGIYAEVTLHYQDRGWQHHEWTFPDYRRADYQEFFTHARDHLRRQERQERPMTWLLAAAAAAQPVVSWSRRCGFVAAPPVGGWSTIRANAKSTRDDALGRRHRDLAGRRRAAGRRVSVASGLLEAATRGCQRQMASCAAIPLPRIRRAAPAGPGRTSAQAVVALGARHGPDAVGTGRRPPGAKLAVATGGGSGRGGGWSCGAAGT